MTTLGPAVENELNECEYCPDCNEELEKSGMSSYFGFCYKCQRKVTHDEVNAFNKGIIRGATLQKEWERERVRKAIDELAVYQGVISKYDAWRKNGDELCDFIEEKVKEYLRKELGIEQEEKEK